MRIKNTNRLQMERFKLTTCGLIVAALLSSQSTLANSEDFFELQKSNGNQSSVFKPKDMISINVPSQFDLNRLSSIAIEFDNLDVTEMTSVDNGLIQFTPVQPMQAGEHEFRLVEYTQEGEINELGAWTIKVKMSTVFDTYGVSFDTQLNSNYRVSEKNTGEPLPDKLQSEATSQVGFTAKNGDWKAEGQFDLYYTSVAQNRFSKRTIDSNEFGLKIGNSYLSTFLGHQEVGQSNLVMDSFRRRGISVQGKIPQIRTTLTGFSLSSAELIGFGNGLGIGNSLQRVDGYRLSLQPIETSPEALNVTSTWLSGQSQSEGDFTASFENDFEESVSGQKGTAWSFVADSTLSDNRLRLRAELAESNFDFNPNDNFAQDKGQAKDMLVTFTDYLESGVSWNIGANYKKIGTYFKSLANLGLPTDLKLSKVFGGIQRESVSAEIGIEEQKDNLSNIAQIPVTTTDLNQININWNPALEEPSEWFGTPSFSLGFNRQSQLQSNIPEDYGFPTANNSLDNWQLSSSFNYEVNSWGVTLMKTEFVDLSQVQNDSDTSSLTLFANFLWQDSNSIAPSIQLDSTKDLVTGITSKGLTYSIQSSMVFVPNTLDGVFNFVYSENNVTDNSLDGDNLAVNLAFNWHISEASPNRFGIDLSLSGMYNDFQDRLYTPNSLQTSQVFLTATLTLPTRIGQVE